MIDANIPTTRAAHLLLFCDILRDVGTPVERELERNGLPANVAEMPSAMVNNVFATRFVGLCAKSEGVEDLGWFGASHFGLPSFTDEVTSGLRSRASLSGKIAMFKALSELEDSHMEVGIAGRGELADLVCDMRLPTDLPGMNCSEWVQLAVMIEIVRSVVGPQWKPLAFNFRTTFKPSEDARAAFPNSLFRFGQPKTSITVNSGLLDCCHLGQSRFEPSPEDPATSCQTSAIKRLLRPYLLNSSPPIELVAEMTGTSARSLQRWLSSFGTSYRVLINETRTEMAREMLADDNLSLIQIAVQLGYENQSNFGRYFKREVGVSPAAYRRGLKKTQLVKIALNT